GRRRRSARGVGHQRGGGGEKRTSAEVERFSRHGFQTLTARRRLPELRRAGKRYGLIWVNKAHDL
ncbi:MAG: hypothetical protein WBE51_06840, partial [Xanthobacteraceae bacterium]